MRSPFRYKKLLQYFLQGLLILAPIAITAYAIFWVVTSIDSLLPIFTYQDLQGNVRVQNYGIGFVIIIAALIIIGYFSSFFITGRVVSFVDKILEKTPGIKLMLGSENYEAVGMAPAGAALKCSPRFEIGLDFDSKYVSGMS